MKRILNISFVVLLISTVVSCAKEEGAYKIVVNGGENFERGSVVSLWRTEIVESPDPVDIIGEMAFDEDGKVVFEGTTKEVYNIGIAIASADGERNLAKLDFPLEPGTTEILYSSSSDYSVKGGKYVSQVVNSWNENPEYKKAKKEFLAYKVTNFKDSVQRATWGQLMLKLNDAKFVSQEKIVNEADDPLLKLLVYGSGYFGDPRIDVNVIIENLVEEVGPEHRESMAAMLGVKFRRESSEAGATVGIGSVIKDFAAEDLSGKKFQLADVLQDNKYVLVEFWASWCGPCRVEIPHMKRAYNHYKDKGFEIVSFTLDDKRERWEKASKDEGIPWVDTGDLLAYTSPVAKMYGVRGVPANYLVEAASGEIVARDLRQEKLDNKLAELFD